MSAPRAAPMLLCPMCERTFESGEVCPDDHAKLVRLATGDPLIGRTLDDRYTLVAKLGDGGMGAVYRATQHSVGRDVALKVLAPALAHDPLAIKRFLREAKLASRLAHPNAVGVVDFGQSQEGLFFIVMELVEGRSLQDVLDRDPVLPIVRVVRIATQICDALEGAHALQIVHRDLKPANVMLLASGRDLVKVLDFGIAKSLSPQDTHLTQVGATVGTPAFMPPESATGAVLDTRADLYSLGCLLYLMLTGNLPFTADTVSELFYLHRDAKPPPMFGVPPDLAAIVMKLLEKQPADRFASAAATRDALEAAYTASRDHLPTIARADEPTGFGEAPTPALQAPSVTSPLVSPTAEPTPLASAVLTAAEPRSRRGKELAAALVTMIAAAIVTFAIIHARTSSHAAAPAPPDARVAALADAAPAAPVALPPAIDAAVPIDAAAPPAVDAAQQRHSHSPHAPTDAGEDPPF